MINQNNESMDKKALQTSFDILNQLYNKFWSHYQESQNGRNKAIRAKAQKEIDHVIGLTEYHILNNSDVYEILTHGQNQSDYGKAVIMDEFIRPHYFKNDMSELLEKLKEKLNTLED